MSLECVYNILYIKKHIHILIHFIQNVQTNHNMQYKNLFIKKLY